MESFQRFVTSSQLATRFQQKYDCLRYSQPGAFFISRRLCLEARAARSHWDETAICGLVAIEKALERGATPDELRSLGTESVPS